MKPAERDQLLSRLDERSLNTWKAIEQLQTHQAEQNGILLETVKSCAKNTIWRKTIMGIGSLSVAGLSTWLAKLQGWLG